MAGLSALITNCQANVFKKTLKIVTGSSNFYDKLLGSLLSVLSNIFLIKDKQFKKLHLCLVGGGELWGRGGNYCSLKADVPCKTICLQTKMKESQKQL